MNPAALIDGCYLQAVVVFPFHLGLRGRCRAQAVPESRGHCWLISVLLSFRGHQFVDGSAKQWAEIGTCSGGRSRHAIGRLGMRTRTAAL